MANAVYNQAKYYIAKNGVDNITFHALVTKTGFAADIDDDTVTAALAGGYELYTSGANGYLREVLDNAAMAIDDANDWAILDETVDLAFGSPDSGVNATGVLIFAFVTDDDGSLPLVWLDTGGDDTTGQPMSMAIPATGVLKFA